MTSGETLLLIELIRSRDREIARLEVQQEASRVAINALADYAVQVREYLEARDINIPAPPVNRFDSLWGGRN